MKLKRKTYNPQNYQKYKAKRAESNRIKKYGLDNRQFETMFKRQNGLCALCKEPFLGVTPCVDHDHKTDRVRGLLHRNCNVLVGMADEDIQKLNLAVDYLELHERVR